MKQLEIQRLIQLPYNRNNWRQFLGHIFTKTQFFSKPDLLMDINKKIAPEAFRLGNIFLEENGIERVIGVYEVVLGKGIVLERNRVGLRNLLRKYWKNIDGAFIAFYHTKNNNWRFTYVSELTGFDTEGELINIKTEPKRYTYILGEGESCRTAAERFNILANKGNNILLEDIKEAFSVEKLSKAFFEEYKLHYLNFCSYLMKPGFRQAIFMGDEKAIRDFNKKLLGRIVFLYFLQKKGWLGVPVNSSWGHGDPNFLSNLFKKTKNKELFYSKSLCKLFFDTLNTKRKDDLIEIFKGEVYRIPYLNGGLFEEENPKYRSLVFPTDLFEGLFEFLNQYNFTIYEDDPDDHTVAVDPEMLGHIFENLLEDNKDKGAFYTPKEIVHYMCQESLIEYLTTWFRNKGYEINGYIGFDKPDEPLLFSANEGRKGQLIFEIESNNDIPRIDSVLIKKLLNKKLDNSDKDLLKKHACELNEALDSVKICDPAIGSGAFPMGLLHEVFTAKQTLYIYEHGSSEGFDASAIKLNIIQNSIYGVDIEKGAVDIARLRFWLSLIVDDLEPKPLPNLDYKIVVGDSLINKLDDDVIDIDWSIDETSQGLFGAELALKKRNLLEKISAAQKEYFNPQSDKKKLSLVIRDLKIDLIINQLELMVKTQGIEARPIGSGSAITKQTEIYLQTIGWKDKITKLKKFKNKSKEPLTFFDWKLSFPEVMNEQVAQKTGFDILVANPPYVDIKNLPPDVVDLLFEKYETTENRINLYSIFIEKAWSLLKDTGILNFIVPNSLLMNSSYSKARKMLLNNVDRIIKLPDNIFINAIVETIIIQAKKLKDDSTIKGAYYMNNEGIDFERLNFNVFNKKYWGQDKAHRFNIFISPKVDNLIKKIENAGIVPLANYFDFSLGITPYDKYKGHSKKLIDNRSFHSPTKIDNTYVPLISGSNISRYYISNEIQEYLKYGDWLGAPRQQKYFTQPRVIVRQIISGKPPQIYAGYTEEELYHTQIGFAILEKPNSPLSTKILCALLNSKLLNFYHKYKFTDPEKDTFQKILIENCKEMPVPKDIPARVKKQIESLVKKISSLVRKGHDLTNFEQQLDYLIYKLYGLSYNDVKIIDPEINLKETEYSSLKL